MVKNELDFFENYSCNVEFELDGEKHIGLFVINSNSVFSLQINNNDFRLKFAEHRRIDLPIVCNEIGENRMFTLHEAELHKGIIFFEYVTTGSSVPLNFDTVEIELTGVSAWLERLRCNEITEFEFRRDIHIESFSVEFDYEKTSYSIKNKRYILASEFEPSKHLIEVQDIFVISKKNGTFSLGEVKKISQEIRNLFSLLVGHALSIKNIYLLSNTEQEKRKSCLFLSVCYEKFPLNNFHQALCFFDDIIEWNLWDSIINNYFRLDSFRTIWNRIVPLLSTSFSRIWEYDILSVVVTLEMYCEKVSEDTGYKLSQENFKDFKKVMVLAIDKYIENKKFSCDDRKVFDGFIDSINNLKNTTHPTLQHKYSYLMEKTSPEIRDMINFSDSDFSLIKKIRNSVAHGLIYKVAEAGNITKENKIKDNLFTLLIYFIFHELGFSDKQIASNLSHTANSIVLNTNINNRIRDKLADNGKFITLSENVSLDNLKYYEPIVLNYNQTHQKYTLHKEFSHEVQHNWTKSEFSKLDDFVKSVLLKNKDTELDFFNRVYVTSGIVEKLFWVVVVLTIE